jgi:hypothetical protein
VFLAIVVVLIVGLIYLSKVTMALFGVILFLIALLAIVIALLLRRIISEGDMESRQTRYSITQKGQQRWRSPLRKIDFH